MERNLKQLITLKKRKISAKEICLSFIFLSAISQCISIAVGNICLGGALVFSILYFIKKPDVLKVNFNYFRTYFIAFIFFFLTLLVASILSPDPVNSLKFLIRIFLYRSSPLLLLLLLKPRKEFLFSLLLCCVLSCMITSLGGILETERFGERINGLFGHPMTLAGFLCIIVPLLFCYLFSYKNLDYKYLISLLIFAFFIFITLLNSTRGAWLALAITLLGMGSWFGRKSWKNLLITAICAFSIVLVVMSSENYSSRFSSIIDTQVASNSQRLEMWQIAYKMWKDHPLVGVGYYRYKQEFQQNYAVNRENIKGYVHPHNNFLFVLADTGLLGASGFCVFFGTILIVSIRKLKQTKNIYYLLIFATTLCIQLQGMTEYNFGNQAVLKLFYMFLGCYIILASENIRELPLLGKDKTRNEIMNS